MLLASISIDGGVTAAGLDQYEPSSRCDSGFISSLCSVLVLWETGESSPEAAAESDTPTETLPVSCPGELWVL